MKSFLMVSAAAAVLSLGLAAPAAADCAADIASLKQQSFTGSVNAASTDAAAPATDTTAPAGAMAATAPATDADPTTAAAGSAAPVEAAPSASGAPAAAAPGTEATAAMNEATEGIAATPEEVEGQQTAQPAETSPSAEQLAAADEPLAPPATPDLGRAAGRPACDMLARAEAYQQLGNEDACMNLVEQAKAM